MRTFCQFLGEVLRAGPPEMVERLTSWIIALLGALILGIMAYAWWPH
jgi:hypothetical protein